MQHKNTNPKILHVQILSAVSTKYECTIRTKFLPVKFIIGYDRCTINFTQLNAAQTQLTKFNEQIKDKNLQI